MAAEVSKDAIARILESISLLLELKGENPFKVRAYTNAARAIESFAGDLHALARAHELNTIPGVGEAIATKLEELLSSGAMSYFETLKKEFPESIFELFEIQGLGPKKIRVVYEKLQISSIAALEKACQEGLIDELAGFGTKTRDNILRAIERRKKHAGTFRLGDVAAEAESILAQLREHPAVLRISAGGSYRRRREVLHDLDFVASTKQPEQVMDRFASLPAVEEVVARGPTKCTVRLKSGVQADLRVVEDKEYPFALSYFTGSKEHNIVMRQRALDRGWTLNEYRLAPLEGKNSSRPPPVRSEEGLYRALDLKFVEPELRENLGEFAAAESGDLPDLIKLENLRGTFHCHTTASDGHSSLQEMVDAAHELGLEYVGIADHSKSSFQAHGLSVEQLQQQGKEIAAMNKTSDDGFRIFAGVECDILKDGKLDYPDEVLAELEYVVASVHAVFNLSPAAMTKRIIRAISNPYVTFLGHLTGRLLLTREGYPVDIPAILDAAAETGTVIELNANPMRLDMDWRWWPLAREKGVKCVINPDAHRTSGFDHLWFGVATARKGWLTRGDVINCLPLGKIEKELKRKRGLHS